MAEYTVELRKIVESGINIFPFPYDFYDESKRQKFEQDFIRHFYFREIGCETVDRFIFFLEDKMNTVFPYYNELFKANQIEYDVLDNYKLTETITRKRENEGRSRGVSSTVGQTFDEQQTDTTETTNGTGSTIQNENGTSKTVQNGTSETVQNSTSETDTTNNGTVEGSSTKKGTGTSENVQNVTKKFLDTPQGLTDLTNSKYLTTLNQDESNGTTENESTETTTDKQTTTGTGSSDTTVNGTTTGETSDTVKGKTTKDTTENATHNQDSKGTATFTGEQKTTHDNNTRSESAGSESETIETVRRGNVGVDTDSDGIVKHLKLQQILKKIERMFFDECEDLFMGVF